MAFAWPLRGRRPRRELFVLKGILRGEPSMAARSYPGYRTGPMADISSRKADHLDLATTGDVGFRARTTLFECVELVHDALPELDLAAVDTTTTLLGKRLRAPILIAGMTGGTERAERINRELAAIAEERGYAFGLGSQRALLKNRAALSTYAVRDVAPSALLLGNLGLVQATQLATEQVRELCELVGADALCLHLNPAMELVQSDGDRDFRGGLATLERLSRELPIPVVAKETGCGLSGSVAERLKSRGIRHVDVSGAGGTSWVAVEMHRAAGDGRALGETFRDWGIPTAASVALVARHGFDTVFATGGIRDGLDIAKAIALGASAGGIARSSLQALETGGRAGALSFFARIEAELRTTMLLVGAPDLAALRRVPRLLRGELASWAALP
jgi:isopentenyl-diphosphate delta-isomerase